MHKRRSADSITQAMACGLLLLSAVASAQTQNETPVVEVKRIASGLAYPWCLAFLPDGSMLVTQRAGRLDLITIAGDRQEIDGVPPVFAKSQGGLFDVLLDPAFAENNQVYLSYAHGDEKANRLRVARARLQGQSLVELRVIFEATPDKDTPVHYGGRMAFLGDGTLLVTTGDGFDYREAAFQLDNHLGKTVRITTDGSAPADNPFTARDDALPEIWTFGHRNPQGLLFDPVREKVWLHEHGPKGGDELNLLVRGENYGWPVATHGLDYSGARISPFTDLDGTVPPVIHWTPSIAPAGMAIYDGALFPAWQGDLLVASLAERSLRRLDMNGDTVADQSFPVPELEERLRDVRVGPDGAIYVLVDSEDGAIVRIAPQSES